MPAVVEPNGAFDLFKVALSAAAIIGIPSVAWIARYARREGVVDTKLDGIKEKLVSMEKVSANTTQQIHTALANLPCSERGEKIATMEGQLDTLLREG